MTLKNTHGRWHESVISEITSLLAVCYVVRGVVYIGLQYKPVAVNVAC